MPVGAAIGISGVVGAGANLIGGAMQSSAATNAANLQEKQYQQTRSDLAPYNAAGQSAVNQLTAALPALASPITMSEADLEATPGYKFTLAQGLKSVQNSAAARGLGTSGAALKGAASYATGLADQTYNQQFQNALLSRQNTYNLLSGTAGIGANAAAQSGQIGQAGAAAAGSSLTSAGTAAAAGLTGAGNALTNAASTYGGYQWAQQNPYSTATNPFFYKAA